MSTAFKRQTLQIDYFSHFRCLAIFEAGIAS